VRNVLYECDARHGMLAVITITGVLEGECDARHGMLLVITITGVSGDHYYWTSCMNVMRGTEC